MEIQANLVVHRERAVARSVIDENSRSIIVRMPAIASGEDSSQYSPRWATPGTGPNSRLLGDLVLSPPENSADALKAPPYKSRSGLGLELKKFFWQPIHLATQEIAVKIGPLDSYDLSSLQPGTASNDGFEWSGSYGLRGTLYGEVRGASQTAGMWDFFSGIAFASAAAALVALLQELPDGQSGREDQDSGRRRSRLDERGWIRRD